MFCLTEASVSTDWFHNSVSENEIQREREVSHAQIVVRFQKRAHNPLLSASGFDRTDATVPWLGNKRLRLVMG